MPIPMNSDSIVTRNLTVEELLSLDTDSPIRLCEMTAPSTPPSGKVTIYAKSDSRMYLKDDTGTEVGLDCISHGVAVLKTLFDANSILAANADNTPLALAVAASRILGRTSGGNIDSLTPAQIQEIIGSRFFMLLQASRWYAGLTHAGMPSRRTDSSTVSVDHLYGFPIYIPYSTEWDEIGLEVANPDAGGLFKLGVYEDSNGLPGNREYVSPEMTTDVAGMKTATSIALTLAAGWHWAAMRADTNVATFRRTNNPSVYSGEGGLLGASAANTNASTLYRSSNGSYAADAIPATWPATGNTYQTHRPSAIRLKTPA